MPDHIQLLAMQNALLVTNFEWKTAFCNTCVSTVTMNFSKYYDKLDFQAQKRYRVNFSKYYDKLDFQAQKRYREKLDMA